MLWRVYNRNGSPNIVEADRIRIQTHTRDMWFCNNEDIQSDGTFLPKFIVASGEYLKVVKLEDDNAKTELKHANRPDKPKGPENEHEYDSIINCSKS